MNEDNINFELDLHRRQLLHTTGERMGHLDPQHPVLSLVILFRIHNIHRVSEPGKKKQFFLARYNSKPPKKYKPNYK